MTRLTRLAAIGVALAATSLLPAKTQLIPNGSMEYGPGPFAVNEAAPADWTMFGGGERSGQINLAPPSGSYSFKAYGTATTVGAYQDVPVAPGEQVVISAMLLTLSTDKLGGDAEAGIKLEWVDTGGATFDPTELFVLNAASSADVWVPASLNGIAPINAVAARITLVFRYTDTAQGSAFWDDAQMLINGGANDVLNGDFELPAIGPEINPTGIDEWNGFGYQKKSSTYSLDPNFSVEVRGAAGGVFPCDYCGLYTDAGGEIFSNEHVYYQSYVYNPAVGGLSGSAVAGTKIEFFPPEGVELAPPVENLAFDANAPTDTWVQVTVSTEVPPDMTGARLVVVFFDNSDPNIPSGPIYVDDVTATLNGVPITLINPSFEQSLAFGWDRFQQAACIPTRTSELPAEHHGAWSMKIPTGCTAGAITPNQSLDAIPVTPGATISMSAWFLHRASNPQLDPNSRAGVKIQWSIGGVPQHIDIGPPNNTINATSPQNVWNRLYIDATMGPAVNARTRFTTIVARGDSVDSVVYFDNCEAVILNRFDGADVDNDVDQDLADFAELQRTFTGPGGTMKWRGLVFDNHPNPTALGDNDVDADDWLFFEPRFTGPASP